MAEVFARRGDSALVMRGEDGLDEFTTAAPTRVWMARDGKVEESVVDAIDLGLPRSAPGDLRGGDAAFNADAARRMFAGETGPIRDAVLLNAAAAFAAHGGFPGDFSDTMRAGIARAAETVDSGAATALLDRWVAAAQAAKAAEKRPDTPDTPGRRLTCRPHVAASESQPGNSTFRRRGATRGGTRTALRHLRRRHAVRGAALHGRARRLPRARLHPLRRRRGPGPDRPACLAAGRAGAAWPRSSAGPRNRTPRKRPAPQPRGRGPLPCVAQCSAVCRVPE